MAYYQLRAGKLESVLLKHKIKLVEYVDAEKGITLLYRLKFQNVLHHFFSSSYSVTDFSFSRTQFNEKRNLHRIPQ